MLLILDKPQQPWTRGLEGAAPPLPGRPRFPLLPQAPRVERSSFRCLPRVSFTFCSSVTFSMTSTLIALLQTAASSPPPTPSLGARFLSVTLFLKIVIVEV